jgi:hypothetical protein
VTGPARLGAGLALAALLASVGCGDREAAERAPVLPVIAAGQPVPVAALAEAAGTAEEPPPLVFDLDLGGDEVAALEKVGSRPAWRGVLERHGLLARRGLSGALHGTVAADGDGGLLLVDEQRGRGALFVRLALPEGMALTAGDRVVVWGAFEVVGGDGGAGGWRWVATRAGRLPSATGGVGLTAVLPPREPRIAAAPDPTALGPATLARAIEGGLRKRAREARLRFVVVAAPTRHGDGWSIGEDPSQPPAALLLLPGEEPIYGGLDFLSGDERWRLRGRGSYEVTVAIPIRLRRAGLMPVLEAVDTPVAVESVGPPATPPASTPAKTVER